MISMGARKTVKPTYDCNHRSVLQYVGSRKVPLVTSHCRIHNNMGVVPPKKMLGFDKRGEGEEREQLGLTKKMCLFLCIFTTVNRKRMVVKYEYLCPEVNVTKEAWI